MLKVAWGHYLNNEGVVAVDDRWGLIEDYVDWILATNLLYPKLF